MSEELSEPEEKREGKVRPFAWFLAQGLRNSHAKPTAWDCVRVLALLGFVGFAASTHVRWLYLNITKPLGNEHINLHDTYGDSPNERDVALLRRWLPLEGKVGYLSERPIYRHFEARMHLAPLLLDFEWQKYDWVLVDYPVKRDRVLLESPSYQLVANLRNANAFARGMRIYKRMP
jgi:hypothetical protein